MKGYLLYLVLLILVCGMTSKVTHKDKKQNNALPGHSLTQGAQVFSLD